MAEEEKDQQPETTEEPAADAPAEEPTAEEAPAEEAPAAEPAAAEAAAEEPAAEAPAEESAEPAEELSPKQRRKLARSRAEGPGSGPRSLEDRLRERAEARARKAKDRTRWRQTQRQKKSRDSSAGIPGDRQAEVAAPREPAPRKTRQGIVVSSKADKTITVRIDVVRRHKRYHKIMRTSIKLHAHDERNDAGTGDTVRVVECRPMSRTKRWRLTDVLEKAK
jgi:small subunit ribosomal protein S17